MKDLSADRAQLGSRRTKLFYGFGSVAYGVKDHGFQQLLLFYYNQVVGLPARTVGTAILLVLLIDAFADPIVGQISDNLRTRWGRRHPFMYASAIPVAITDYLLWTPPHWSQNALFFYLLGLGQVLREMYASLAHPSFMILVIAAIFGTVAIGLGTSLLIYFNTYFWGLSSKQIALFQLVGLFSATLGPALAGPLSKRFEKHRSVIAFYICFIFVTTTPITLRLIGFFPANGSVFRVPILFLERSVSGVLGIATLILFGS